MANHCRRGQPLKLGGASGGGGGGGLARGTRDSLNLAIGRGDEGKVKQMLFDDGVDVSFRAQPAVACDHRGYFERIACVL